MALAPVYDWSRHFRFPLCNCLPITEFNETWQEASTQCPLHSLCFFFRPIHQQRWTPCPPMGWDIFGFSVLNRRKEFHETWQEASTRPTSYAKVVFLGLIHQQRRRSVLRLVDTFSTSLQQLLLNGIWRNLTGSKCTTYSIEFVYFFQGRFVIKDEWPGLWLWLKHFQLLQCNRWI